MPASTRTVAEKQKAAIEDKLDHLMAITTNLDEEVAINEPRLRWAAAAALNDMLPPPPCHAKCRMMSCTLVLTAHVLLV